MGKGTFTNYLNMFLAFFDHVLTYLPFNVNISCTKISLLLTTYPPLCVYVICESSLINYDHAEQENSLHCSSHGFMKS